MGWFYFIFGWNLAIFHHCINALADFLFLNSPSRPKWITIVWKFPMNLWGFCQPVLCQPLCQSNKKTCESIQGQAALHHNCSCSHFQVSKCQISSISKKRFYLFLHLLAEQLDLCVSREFRAWSHWYTTKPRKSLSACCVVSIFTTTVNICRLQNKKISN